MTRAKLLIISLGLAMVAMFAVPAAAQDGPTLTIDPEGVDAAGTQTFTVTGSGFTLPSVFVFPCAVPESGDVGDLAADDCDIANLTPATIEDGGFTVEVEFEVPEEGLTIAASDAGQVERAGVIVIPGGGDAAAEGEGEEAAEGEGEEAAEGEGEEAAEEEPAEEEAAEDGAEEEAAAEEGEEAADDGGEDLPETGSSAMTMAIIGLTLALAGALVVGGSRRLARI